ncbi:MAG: hypothetical protein AAGD10_15965 [Myxococcota bacterium]
MGKRDSKGQKWTEFECPECSADNPWGDGFTVGDELFCSWCGGRFRVRRGKGEDDFRLVMD